MLCAKQNFYFNKCESCPFIHLANIVTTNYLPGTVQLTGNSKANKTWALSYRIPLSGEQTDLLIQNLHNCRSVSLEVCRRAGEAQRQTTASQRLVGGANIPPTHIQLPGHWGFELREPSLLKWAWGNLRINNLPLWLVKYLHIFFVCLIVWRNKAGKRQQGQL